MLQIILLCFLFLVVIFFLVSFNNTVASTPVHAPPPPAQLPEHECSKSQYGCCANGITHAGDSLGTNCVHPDIHVGL